MRVSWSILSAWARGDTQAALDMLEEDGLPPTPAMLEGQRIHGWIAQEKMRLLPGMDDTFVWEGAEHHGAGYFKVPLMPGVELSGKVDAYSVERGWIVDWKSGNTPAGSQDPRQIYLYHYLLKTALGKDFSLGAFVRVSGQADVVDWVKVQLTPEKAEETATWAQGIALEIITYLQETK